MPEASKAKVTSIRPERESDRSGQQLGKPGFSMSRPTKRDHSPEGSEQPRKVRAEH